MVFYQVSLLSPLQCSVTDLYKRKRLREFGEILIRLREIEEIEISRQSCGAAHIPYQIEEVLIIFCITTDPGRQHKGLCHRDR
jgi:hypothetical protein